MSKQIHYNIDKINETGANYYIIYGEKSNGKSYQVKHKEAVNHYLDTGMRFILLRRWKEDVSALWIEKYFANVDVSTLTHGRYSMIDCYRKVLYFANLDEDTGKVKRGEKIGYVIALSQEQHLSSGNFEDCDRIIFEEFMERGMYIKDEVKKLEAFYSTVDRKRGVTKMYMVGNTVSRINPYINAWGLELILRTLKQGSITTTTIHKEADDVNEATDIKIAIEYCRASGGKQLSISSNMIDKGGWQADPQPKLPKSKKEYKVLYRMVFYFKSFKFLVELLQDKENYHKVWFIYPKTKEIKKKTIVISDIINTSPYWFRSPYEVPLKNKRLNNLLDTFRENCIFYSDDLTGTDFKQCIDFLIRK